MIVRLKAIKSREDTFCYLSFYLHCSFLWQLVIVTSIVSSCRRAEAATSGCIENVGLYQERLLVSLHHQIVRNHWIIEVLSCCRRVLGIVVVPLLLSCSYPNAVYQFHHSIWLTLLKSERSKTWFHPADKTRTYIQPSIKIHLRKPVGSSRVTSRLSAVSTTQGRWVSTTPGRRASTTQGRRASTTQGRPGRSWCWRPKSQVWSRPASRLSHHFTRSSSNGFLL